VIGLPGLLAIDLSSHSLSWSGTNAFTGSPAASGGEVYVLLGNQVNEYSGGAGSLLQTYQTGDSSTLINQPILTNDLVLVSSSTRTYIFTRYTARLVQTISYGGYLSLAGGRLYIAGGDGTLRTFKQ
jgi:hypothetical protein